MELAQSVTSIAEEAGVGARLMLALLARKASMGKWRSPEDIAMKRTEQMPWSPVQAVSYETALTGCGKRASDKIDSKINTAEVRARIHVSQLL